MAYKSVHTTEYYRVRRQLLALVQHTHSYVREQICCDCPDIAELRLRQIEIDTKVPQRFRFPFFDK